MTEATPFLIIETFHLNRPIERFDGRTWVEYAGDLGHLIHLLKLGHQFRIVNLAPKRGEVWRRVNGARVAILEADCGNVRYVTSKFETHSIPIRTFMEDFYKKTDLVVKLNVHECELCGTTTNVKQTNCPYSEDVHDEIKPANLCDKCYQEACDDI